MRPSETKLGNVIGAAVGPFIAEPGSAERKKMAIITTEWRYLSHAQHMGDRFLVGYPLNGKWHEPRLDVVSLYVDQKPQSDQSEQRSQEFGFKIHPTIAGALRCGGDKIAVDEAEHLQRSLQLRDLALVALRTAEDVPSLLIVLLDGAQGRLCARRDERREAFRGFPYLPT